MDANDNSKLTQLENICNNYISDIVPCLLKSNSVVAKGDSAASNHYWKSTDVDILTDVCDTIGPTVTLPDNYTITSTSSGFLPLPSQHFSTTARRTAVFDNLHSSSLISLGQLCDDNCDIVLTKTDLKVIKNNKIVLSGFRNHNDGLWDIPIRQNSQVKSTIPLTGKPLQPLLSQYLSVIIQKDKPRHDLATYLHAACFSPTKATFLRAISNNNLVTWPPKF